ncbi:MAG: rRNA pseudouridine synthase [Cyanobacteria bacterium SZAS-4]|nr:rRNA pseudouridine synthase [Cyanobacteria bacterium SZAS-4]
MTFRLNRAIAATGFCSRRRADELIAGGKVMVNGNVVSDFNFAVDLSTDKLIVDGHVLKAKQLDYVVIYKPKGVVTTCSDEMGRESILELLPRNLAHLKPVGRLDMDSEGLIILTNDGDLAQSLAHPSQHVFKRYEALVEGNITDAALKQLAKGIRLEDGFTLPAETTLINRSEDESIFEIAIREGRNRQIRRMCAKLGYPIIRLVRVAIGGLQLGEMEPGEWRHLTVREIKALKSGLLSGT